MDVFAISNVDDAVIFWRTDDRIKGCWGYAIERERRLDDGSIRRDILENRAGLPKDEPRPNQHRPSTEWPFQRFSWTDHSVNQGDVVRYRVVPMLFSQGKLSQALDMRSNWTPWLTLSEEAGDKTNLLFNRGLVISQFMSRYLEDLRVKEGLGTLDDALGAFKKSLDDHELPIRKFLSGELRRKLLELLQAAKSEKRIVWAALYELDDEELIAGLEKLGSRCRIVLANGSIQPQKGVPAAELRKKDQNKKARARLLKAGAEVHDRMISPGALGHNKFLVVTDAKRKPLAAWTGSTNWTKTGLCTQINNGFYVENSDFAQTYLDQWDRLKDAKSDFPADLVEENSVAKSIKVGKSDMRIWFTRTRGKVDLDAIEDVLGKAKDAVLFLMFQPGGSGPFGTIEKLVGRKDLYVKGVVSTLPPKKNGAADDEDTVEVVTVGDGQKRPPMMLDIVQPEGIKTPFASWAATVTRKDFLSGKNKVGFAIVHSKVIVVDPFTKPVVITGSHNFSSSASQKNDENFVIVRDNPKLAMQYAAHILSVYQHYRWLNVVYDKQRRNKLPTVPLAEADTWQDRHLKGASKREIDFWVR
ncbi:Phosphatidylserine/phosphatidylglycerophosphate/cardiolipin synthase [Labilithrix luteola]|uniref:phospholipase D n=1 Tax=Labilithrix luteola TaxID=1391654 RepID=A0A0K1Q236_9BACT|nr:Phosphatidylserine/phosphatidylglycerophosphate/cardiolipin synthase [Labilithrix luteola]